MPPRCPLSNEPRLAASARRIFYGWYIVAGVFVITMTTSGLAFYNLSILLAAFVAERGFPVGLASSATATFFIASGIGGAIAGRLVERIDARIVIAGGATIGALALASVGSLRELWQLYAFHVVFGLCNGASGLVPLTTLVARWFSARRALAFSIASTGLSFGGIVVAPAAALLIERLGLAGAAPWMGLALCLGTLPVTAIVLRPRPAAMGLEPDGAAPVEGARAAPQPAVAFAEARRSGYFYAVSVAYLFLLGAQVGAIAHFYRLASTRTGVATAALALSVLAGSSTVGRLAGGWLMLWIASRPFALVADGRAGGGTGGAGGRRGAGPHPGRHRAVRRDHGQLADDAPAAAGREVRHARLRPHLFDEPARHHAGGGGLPAADRPALRGERRLHGALPCGGRADAGGPRRARRLRRRCAGRTARPSSRAACTSRIGA